VFAGAHVSIFERRVERGERTKRFDRLRMESLRDWQNEVSDEATEKRGVGLLGSGLGNERDSIGSVARRG
jgi:hypothetical protein